MYNLVSKWLDEALYSKIGIDFSALYFQLFEGNDYKWTMELVWVIDSGGSDEEWIRNEVAKLERNKKVFERKQVVKERKSLTK